MTARDDWDFPDFAQATRPRLRRTAYLLCGDWDRASDLVQEALIRLDVGWPRIQHGPTLPGYARKIVVSVAIDAGRKMLSTEIPVEEPVDVAGVDPTDQSVDRLMVMTALAQVPPRQRACIVLRYYEDLTVAEVARLWDVAGQVKSQTARGLARLRTVFERAGFELDSPTGPPQAAH